MKLRPICINTLTIFLCLFQASPRYARTQASRQSVVDKSHPTERQRKNFDYGWNFHKGPCPGAQAVAFDDSGWRTLDLPHDWSIEGPYAPNHPSGAPCGYLPCGIGWYRKKFHVEPEYAGKKIFVEFDGIYMNSDVWINGQHLGKRPYGYIGFQYDLTPYLTQDKDNVLAVRVDNSRQPSTRWYSGSGIYRHVWLTVTNTIHVDYHGKHANACLQ